MAEEVWDQKVVVSLVSVGVLSAWLSRFLNLFNWRWF